VKNAMVDLGLINNVSGRPKFLQIADRVRELIDSGALKLGDRLPSVNQVISHFSVSRDTAVKAYQVLKDKGIIETTPHLACFVSNVLIRDDQKKVLFLTDAMTPYKQRIYYGLIDTLPPGYYIDVMAHSDDFDLLKHIYEKYSQLDSCAACLIIPTAAQNHEREYFRYINPGKLLFLDRPVQGVRHPAVWQDFNNGFRRALEEKGSLLKKYRRLVFLTKFFTNPIIEEMKTGLEGFSEAAGLDFIHRHTMFTDREIQGKAAPENGDLFVVLDDNLLLETLAECRQSGLVPGRDTGIMVINEGPFYSQLSVPVSVLSADFYAMGIAAARFVTTGVLPQEPITTSLTATASL
jgi:DNA-binding transcriptional regulator YhcF (GntR family)